MGECVADDVTDCHCYACQRAEDEFWSEQSGEVGEIHEDEFDDEYPRCGSSCRTELDCNEAAWRASYSLMHRRAQRAESESARLKRQLRHAYKLLADCRASRRRWLDEVVAEARPCSDVEDVYSIPGKLIDAILGVLPAKPASTFVPDEVFYAALFESESIGARRANAMDRLNDSIDRLAAAMGPLGSPFLRLVRRLR